MESLQGQFLVASPHLRDPNFVKTVVLLIRHDEHGALGVVLNRPADKTVKELWESVSQTPCTSDKKVNLGGPVPGPLMAIHTRRSLADVEVISGVYFAAERDKLEALIAGPVKPFRIFVGHSGWGGGQLESELEQGAWLTAPATLPYIFYEESDLWEKVAKQIGKSMLQSMLDIDFVPDDPSAN